MSRKTLKWLLPLFLAGAFMATSPVFVHGQGGNQVARASSKADRRQHSGELRYQRQRIKESGKSVRAEARLSGHPGAPPKAERHHVSKAHQHSIRQTPNLRHARKQNRSHRTVHRQVQKN
ncbi:MAG TPA: hypothetical protein VNG91_05340 [Terriglobia bacterium]|nr:hypothetical protein [Terriglobia bacterium]